MATGQQLLRQKRIQSRPAYSPFVACLFLLFCFQTNANAEYQPDKNWLRIVQSKDDEKHDLNITSIGGLVLNKEMIAHIDLSSIKSESNGDAWTLDIGGGFTFNWDISLFVSLGVSLGHNTDTSENIAAYYPEAGAVFELSDKLGLIISAKRYHHLYEENEKVVMLGLVFKN